MDQIVLFVFNILPTIYSSTVYYISFERAQKVLSREERLPSRKVISLQKIYARGNSCLGQKPTSIPG